MIHKMLLAALVALPLTAAAAGLSFLRATPVSYFTDEDVEMMMKTAGEALESDDRQARDWLNPKTGNSGSLQVRSQFTAADGAPCKRLRVSNKARGIEGEATYTVCKYPDRGWIINTEAAPAQNAN